MLSCKEVTRLLSKAREAKLSVGERVQLKLHMLLCSFCRIYREQFETISNAVGALSNMSRNGESAKECPPMPDDVRERLCEKVRRESQEP